MDQAHCNAHADRRAPFSCDRCGLFLCPRCAFQFATNVFCRDCTPAPPSSLKSSARVVGILYMAAAIALIGVGGPWVVEYFRASSGAMELFYSLVLSILVIFITIMVFVAGRDLMLLRRRGLFLHRHFALATGLRLPGLAFDTVSTGTVLELAGYAALLVAVIFLERDHDHFFARRHLASAARPRPAYGRFLRGFACFVAVLYALLIACGMLYWLGVIDLWREVGVGVGSRLLPESRAGVLLAVAVLVLYCWTEFRIILNAGSEVLHYRSGFLAGAACYPLEVLYPFVLLAVFWVTAAAGGFEAALHALIFFYCLFAVVWVGALLVVFLGDLPRVTSKRAKGPQGAGRTRRGPPGRKRGSGPDSSA